MNVFFRKLILTTLAFCLVISPIYADDEIYEELSIFEVDESISVSSDVNDVPEINARHAIVLDRASKTILYGKKETEQCKMASTTNVIDT